MQSFQNMTTKNTGFAAFFLIALICLSSTGASAAYSEQAPPPAANREDQETAGKYALVSLDLTKGDAEQLRSMTPEQRKKYQKAKKLAAQAERVRAVETSQRATDVNQQLQDMIKMNEALKTSQRIQSMELQHIAEQARIHQQILKNLESAKIARNTSVNMDVNEVLRQEKIRLIREQTERSQQVMDSIERNKRIR